MTVIACSGHQVIPSAALAFVSTGIRNVLQPHEGHFIGTCSLAAGADQMFASAVLEHKGALRVVIPSARYDETFTQSDRRQYELFLKQAAKVEVLPFGEPSEEAYLAAGLRIVDAADVLIAVWDGQPARGLGGTADVVDYARANGTPVVIVWPTGISRNRYVARS